jgi:hypothetical protein
MTPSDKERIEAAIAAHVKWMSRLREAVATGQSEFTEDQVRVDDRCEFGKWIYSDFKALCPPATFEAIRHTHAEFHRTAAQVLTMALGGRKDEAKVELASGARLSRLSGELILGLRNV